VAFFICTTMEYNNFFGKYQLGKSEFPFSWVVTDDTRRLAYLGGDVPGIVSFDGTGLAFTPFSSSIFINGSGELASTGGSGVSNLSLGAVTLTTRIISNSNGTGVTLPAATTTLAGLLSGSDKVKLDSLSNYTHPNHSGDVTSVSDGVTTISVNAVNNTKLSDMPANTVKVRNVSTVGDPVDMLVLNNQLVGRGPSGDIQPISLGANLTISGATLNSSGLPDGDKGDITVSGTSTVFTIDNGVVTNAKLNTMPASTIKGAVTLGTPEDLTPSQVKIMLSYLGSEITNIPAGNISATNLQAALNELDTEKQGKIQFQEDATNVGTSGQFSTINFTGASVALTPIGATLVVDVTGGGGGGGSTNIAESTRTTTTVLVTSDTGTDATLSPATSSLAGVMSAADKTKLDALGVSSNGLSGTGVTSTPFKLGGTLTENTTISGATLYDLLLTQMDSVFIEANDGTASKGTLSLTTPLSLGSFLRQEHISNATQAAEVRVDADGPLTRFIQQLGDAQSGVLIPSHLSTELIANDGINPVKNYGVTSTDHFIKGLKSLSSSQIVHYNSSTEVLSYSTAPPVMFEYDIPITSGNTNSKLRVVATTPSLTAAFSSGVLTLSNPPAATRIMSVDWRYVSADIQAASDGVTTQWVRVVLNSNTGNTGIDDMRVPIVQKTAIPSTGALAFNNAASIDIDNNPAVTIVGVGSGTITIRISGLTAGAQGGHLKFTNI